MDIIITAIVFGVCQILVFACFAVFIHWYVGYQERRIRKEIEDLVRAFLTAPDDKTPSPLAMLVDQGALLLASRLMQQLKAMLAGTESGLAKGENRQLQLDMMDNAPPWASMILGILPARLRNQLLRNPQMVGQLARMTGNHAGDSEVTEIQRRMQNMQ